MEIWAFANIVAKNNKIYIFDKQRQNKTSVIVLFALTCFCCCVKIYMIKIK